MPLNVNQPTDQVLVAELPAYIRANRIAINAFVAGDADIVTTDLTIVGGTTALVVGTDLSSVALEVVLLAASGPATLTQIRGGSEGQIKIFIFQNNNTTLTDGVKSLGQLYLNQLPVLTNFVAQQDDVLALANIDGDGSTVYGYWKELWRQISVK